MDHAYKLVSLKKKNGSKPKFADEAIALQNAAIDAIVAAGFEAGGHQVSFLQPAENSFTGTFTFVPQVADARGLQAALALGADAAK